jgi:hypothetical protein
MTTTSFRMNRRSIASLLLPAIAVLLLLSSCKKDDHNDDGPYNNGGQPSSYSADVIDKWMTLQLRLMRNATGIPNQAFTRHFAYAGIAAVESLSPGTHGNNKLSHLWNGLSGLPVAHHKKYYYPANVNAALASINKAMFPNANAADKAAIDSLENALNQLFLATEKAETITASNQYGKEVATAVFNWSEGDGYKVSNGAYTPPVGAGLWVPTPPAFAAPASPYWGNNRPVVINSTADAFPPPPIAYSTTPGSPFHNMVKNVYDVSQSLTADQMAAAMFWRDVPGPTSPGHWLSIVHQVIQIKNSRLDKAAIAYALTGAAINDAAISCWNSKYFYNLVRPITYIRNTMGHTSWNSYIGTPAHPEYASGHSVLSGATAEIMEHLYGNIGSFTDHSNDYLGQNPRTYPSFTAIAKEAAQSRVWGGIHYQQTVDLGLLQGKKIALNILGKKNGN